MNYKVLVRVQKMPVHSCRCHASIDVMTNAARNFLRKYNSIYATQFSYIREEMVKITKTGEQYKINILKELIEPTGLDETTELAIFPYIRNQILQ